MGKVQDLTGKRFGRLIVIKRSENYISPKGYSQTKWLCKCDCGVEVDVLGNGLKRGDTASCGCLRKDVSSEKAILDLTGKDSGGFWL